MTDNINADIRDAKFTMSLGGFNQLLMGAGNIAVYWLAAIDIMQGDFSIGMLFAFMAYKSQFTGKASSLIDLYYSLKMLGLHSERVADIALTKTEVDGQSAIADKVIEGRIELHNASFRYSDSEPWIFQNIDLTVEAGESIALVGASSCGKTTLLKVMLGLLPLTQGEIKIDGIPLEKLGLINYRRQVAAVMQEDVLLTGSIQDNIAFFDTEFNPRKVKDCANIACIHEDISRMPMGYNTLVGDLGTTLSGGQKQRILLARALYSHPRMLFMDEATSHLDVKLEKQINENIRRLKATRIIIAHRPETIKTAQNVFRFSSN